ncbi:MAG: sugar transferase [Alphaproteobacteria bacterium]|nr:sugar transferase [Alphaproteobacteria bacterium]
MKRLVDIAISAAGLIVALPVIAVIAIIIRLETPGNPFFGQTRLGRNEHPFTIWKLRSMHQGTPALGTHEVAVSALTRTGHFIRRTKLDELPQLINILRGHMSLVGPRPCLPNQDEVIAERRKKNVFEARPGVTGLAQIRGIDMSMPVELAACDRAYLDTQSFGLDLSICIQTVTGATNRPGR